MQLVKTFSFFLLFVIVSCQEEGDVGMGNESEPEQELTEPTPTTKKPRRSTTITQRTTTPLPLPLAKTESPEPLPEECTDRFDFILPLLSTCANCTDHSGCRKGYVCCPTTNIPILGIRNPGQKCCVIRKPEKATETP